MTWKAFDRVHKNFRAAMFVCFSFFFLNLFFFLELCTSHVTRFTDSGFFPVCQFHKLKDNRFWMSHALYFWHTQFVATWHYDVISAPWVDPLMTGENPEVTSVNASSSSWQCLVKMLSAASHSLLNEALVCHASPLHWINPTQCFFLF